MTILLVITVSLVVILSAVCFGLILTVFGFNSRLEQAYDEVKAATVRQRRAETALRDSGLNPQEQALAADARRAEVNRLNTVNAELKREVDSLRETLAAESPDQPDSHAG